MCARVRLVFCRVNVRRLCCGFGSVLVERTFPLVFRLGLVGLALVRLGWLSRLVGSGPVVAADCRLHLSVQAGWVARFPGWLVREWVGCLLGCLVGCLRSRGGC